MNYNYDRKIIFNYVNGNDIKGYQIDQLEKDYKFMMDVINYTNDCKIYNLCSEEIKNNYEFVKFLVFKFSSNKKFICEVADYYIKFNNDDLYHFEMNLIMANIIGKTSDDKLLKYQIVTDTFTKTYKKAIKKKLSKEEDINFKKELGMGFIYLQLAFQESKLIVEHIAKSLIQDIFKENETFNLEGYLHKNFKNKEQLASNINKFIIDYIRAHDLYLSDYVVLSLPIISDINESIEKIIKRWDHFEFYYNSKMVDLALYEIYKIYQVEYKEVCFSESELICYVVTKLNKKELFKEYDNKIVNGNNDVIYEINTIKDKMLSIKDYKVLKEATKKVNEVLHSDEVLMFISNYYQEQDFGLEQEENIIEFGFQNQKKFSKGDL